MEHKRDKVFIALFVAFLVIIPILSVFFPESELSVFEQRYLAEIPEFSVERLIDTKYYNEWEDYFNDRIFARTKLLALNTKFNVHILKKPVVNGITVTDDALLAFDGFSGVMHKDIDVQLKLVTKNIRKLNEACKKNGAKLYMLGIPEQGAMLQSKYPAYMQDKDGNIMYTEDALFKFCDDEGIESLRMRDVFEKMDYEKLYSKIDHHYNFYGAFETYRSLVKKISETSDFDLTPLDYDDMIFETIDLPFYGSRSRKLFGEYSDRERMYIGYPKHEIYYQRSEDGGDPYKEVFAMPTGDFAAYTVYMGGDMAETAITTGEGRENLPRVLMIGDSFTNPLETLLYYNCNEFRSLDFRYYTKKTIVQYIDEYKPDIVIYLRDSGSYLNTEGNGNMNLDKLKKNK